MTKKILVAVDGSEDSTMAVNFSAAVSKATGWELVLLHIVEMETAARELRERVGSEGYSELVGSSYLTAKLAQVLDALAPFITAAGVKYFAHVVVGDPAERILEVARSMGVDMIVAGVVGSNGKFTDHSGVARRVAERSEIPVMLIPRGRDSEWI